MSVFSFAIRINDIIHDGNDMSISARSLAKKML